MSCSIPFDQLYLLPNGVIPCCPAWIDDEWWPRQLNTQDPWEIWNHPKIVRLRTRILDGDLSQCKNCNRLLTGCVPEEVPKNAKPTMDRPPLRLLLANEVVCNLYCWSCRQSPIYTQDDPGNNRERLMQNVMGEFLPYLDILSLSHNGDPFQSPIHMRMLRSLDLSINPNLKIELFTNGQLLSAVWPSIPNIHKNVWKINMSVDAASKEIYEKLRRGGKWDRLQQSLSMISELRSQDLREFQMNMVVQVDNFREIPQFIEMAKKYQATQVVFNLLRPRDIVSSEYQSHSLCNPQCPDIEEFMEILSNPLLDDPIVSSYALNIVLRNNYKERYCV